MKKFYIVLLLSLSSLYSNAAIVVKNGLTHVHELDGSLKQRGKILVANTGSKTQRVILYLNDLSIKCDGEVNYTEPGTVEGSLNGFLKLETQEVTLGAKEEYEINYQIDFSNGDFTEGSFWSLIMVEGVEPISVDKSKPGVEVGTKIRYAIQIVSNLGSSGTNDLSFTDIKLGKDPANNKLINVVLKNDGNFLVYPSMELQVFDQDGNEVKRLLIAPRNVYPRNCQAFKIGLEELEKGKYKAVLFAEYQNEVVGVNLDLEI